MKSQEVVIEQRNEKRRKTGLSVTKRVKFTQQQAF